MAIEVEQITLTPGIISARKLTLTHTPVSSTEVAVDPIGGPAQEYGVDYSVSLNEVSWGIGSDIDSIANTPGSTVILRIIYER
jgi:hypothetical protein